MRNPDSNTEHTEVAYYSLAKSTGGNIYLVNPDKTALELPRIMRQNTTLGEDSLGITRNRYLYEEDMLEFFFTLWL